MEIDWSWLPQPRRMFYPCAIQVSWAQTLRPWFVWRKCTGWYCQGEDLWRSEGRGASWWEAVRTKASADFTGTGWCWAGWCCRVTHIDTVGYSVMPLCWPVTPCGLCPGRGLTLDKWALFSCCQCSEGAPWELLAATGGGIGALVLKEGIWMTHPPCFFKKEKAVGFHCFTPLVSLLSLQLGLPILPSAASASRTNPEPLA